MQQTREERISRTRRVCVGSESLARGRGCDAVQQQLPGLMDTRSRRG